TGRTSMMATWFAAARSWGESATTPLSSRPLSSSESMCCISTVDQFSTMCPSRERLELTKRIGAGRARCVSSHRVTQLVHAIMCSPQLQSKGVVVVANALRHCHQCFDGSDDLLAWLRQTDVTIQAPLQDGILEQLEVLV